MKITLAAKDLACALKSAALLVETRTTIPILAHALVDANPAGGIAITTTNLDQTFTAALDATVSEAGRFTVPVRNLLAVASDADGMVEIESETAKDKLPSVTVRFGRSSIKLSGLPPEDFPKLIDKKRPCVFDLGASDLRHLIDMTQRCISTEETRYYLNGLYLHAAGNPKEPRSLCIVATDDHRLAKADLPTSMRATKIPPVIIPKLTVSVLRRLIDKAKEPIAVELSDDHGACLRFSSGNWSLISKDIDGTFPDYGRVIPTQNKNHVEIAKADLLRTIKQVGKIVSKTPGLRFDINQNSIEVIGRTEDLGTASSNIDCRSNLTMEIGLNWRYVLDAIEVMAGDTVVLDIAKNTDPVVIRDPADANYLHVLMPMRV